LTIIFANESEKATFERLKQLTMHQGYSLRWVLIILLSVPFGLFAQIDSLSPPEKAIAKSWFLTAVNQGEKGTVQTQKGDLFVFDGQRNFRYNVQSDETSREGQWRVMGDSLYLSLGLQSQRTPIDSLVYDVDASGNAVVVLYRDGKEFATQSAQAYRSQIAEEAYQIVYNADSSNLSLVGADIRFEMKRLIMEAGGFSFSGFLRGILGMVFLLGMAWVFSSNRKAIDWQLVGAGVTLQILLAVLVLKVPGVSLVFDWISGIFVEILGFTSAGVAFLFSPLIDVNAPGVVFAFQVLPTIVFFSALTAILYYLGVLQKLVYGFAWLMSKTMRLSGAESLAAAGNIFLGQTESPLLVRHYLEKMTRSEIMALMTGGMATIAGSVFAGYVLFLGGTDEAARLLFAKHLLTASIISAPAALVAAKMMVPETEEVSKDLDVPKDKIGANLLDAIANGSTDGLKLAINVGVMLLVFIALIKMVNWGLADKIGEWTNLNQWVLDNTDGRYTEFNLQYIFGLLFAPVAWLLGVPSDDIMIVGQLLGEKTIINEFVAYSSMGNAKDIGMFTHYKSILISTYALCGFANFSSIGIQIGGIGALAPNQRRTLSELGIRSLIGGTLAAFMTAVLAGVII
jgi:CNT family concentrative nucleoside transporter